jgi:Polyketide cyclase / dehydrase and lipid transport
MASIYKTAHITASPEAVWEVVRDVGAVHTRFAPGFVVDVLLEDGARMVTFANGLVAREVFITLDEAGRRLVYSVRTERMEHHNASFQVFADGDASRLVWIADVLPDAAGDQVGQMMQAGIEAAKTCLDKLGGA